MKQGVSLTNSTDQNRICINRNSVYIRHNWTK